jgi:site-specific recombinase XerD
LLRRKGISLIGISKISKKLNLSVELKLKTARDSYATTLKRAGKSKDEISEMLGHSNSVVTEHYLASLDMEKTFDINDCLF